MQEIPIQAIPSQMTKCVLDGQNVQISIYTKTQCMFCDVNSDGIDIVTAVSVLDAVPIICRNYAGFIGNLVVIDTQGNDDPVYTGLGDRFKLVYLTDSEI